VKEKDMEHHWFEDRVSAWLDQGLPVMEQSAMDEHVATCKDCTAQAERFRSLDRLVQRHANLKTDHAYFDDLAAKTNERIFGSDRKSENEKTTITPISWWRWTAVAAGVILTSVVSWKVFEEQPKVRQLSAPAVESKQEKEIPLSDSVMKSDSFLLNADIEKSVSESTPLSVEKKLMPSRVVTQVPATNSPSSYDGKGAEAAVQEETSSVAAGLKSDEAESESPQVVTTLESPIADGIRDSAAISATDMKKSIRFRAGGEDLSGKVSKSSPEGDLKSLSKEAAPRNLAAPRMNAQSVDTIAVASIRRLLQLYKAESDTTRQRIYHDSLQAAYLQHPQLPADLIQQLDSLGFSR
jgi:hypothetical protein